MTRAYEQVVVVGNWHQAFVTAGGLCELGNRVLLVDSEGKTRLDLNEPGLDDVFTRHERAGSLSFTSSLPPKMGPGTSFAFAWLAIDTPVDETDIPQLETVESALRQLRERSARGFRVIVSCQVPLGFAESMERELGLELISIPENLQLGAGLRTFLEADRVVIGATHEAARNQVRQWLGALRSDFVLCDLNTAEMIKHATNAFLATSISLANQLAMIGSRYGVDNPLVGQALKKDKRIGPKAYVLPGTGFSGGTLPRDLRVLQRLGRAREVPTPLIDSVLEINESTWKSVAHDLAVALGGLQGRRILVLGYSYKPAIDTLRRSPALQVAEILGKEGAEVFGFDPIMNGKDLRELDGKITHLDSLDSLPFEADALITLTAREAFRGLSLPRSKGRALAYDCVNVLDAARVEGSGWVPRKLWSPLTGPFAPS